MNLQGIFMNTIYRLLETAEHQTSKTEQRNSN